MSQTPPPPPPDTPSRQPAGSDDGPGGAAAQSDAPSARPSRGSGTAGWRAATVLTAVVGLVLSATTYLLMDRQISNLEDDLDAARAELAETRSDSGSGSGDGGGLGELEDLLGELDPGDLGGLEDLLGGLGGEMANLDPILFECLGGTGMGLGGEGSVPDADLETQVQAVQDIVEDERGLSADGDLSIDFVSLDEVQRRAVELTEKELDRERAQVEARFLQALGAVEPGTDLAQAQLDALDAGVGGFYNPDTGELVIGSEQMDGTGAYITAHEIVHALADTTFGLPDTVELAESAGADAAYAALNAIEGDASLYGQMFTAEHLPMDQLLALQSEAARSQAELDEMPYFVRRNLEFPYVEGMTFTCDIFLDGGWSAVDETYTELPTTSAQILFPDRYRDGETAVQVRQPADPDGWSRLAGDTFGAADLLFLLEAPGGDPDAALDDPTELAQGWAGGSYTVWDRSGETAVALVLAQHHDGPALCETMTDYYAAAFPDSRRSGDGADVAFEGDDQSAVVTCDGAEVALGVGPDLDTARAAVA